MDIRFLITYKGQIVQLPVNPEAFKLPYNGNNKTEEIIKLGEVNILKQRKLSSFTLTSFLPQDLNRPYVLTTGIFQKPQFYIDFFLNIMNDKDKKPCTLTVYGLNLNIEVTLEDFEYEYTAGDEDVKYTLKFKEYVKYSAKTVILPLVTTPSVTATTSSQTKRQKTGIAIGDTVIVNGRYWYSSYGAKPYGTFNNFKGKVSHIVANKSRKYRYHITTLNGGYRGWVGASQISVVE